MRAFKLAEDLPVALARDVGKHAQATAVSHADVYRFDAVIGSFGEHRVQQRNQGFSTLEAESLLPDVLRLQEGFERFGLVELLENADLFVVIRFRPRHFQFFPQPRALIGILDMHILHTDLAAVGITHDAEDVAQQHTVLPTDASGGELAVEVPEGQTVAFELEIRVGVLLVFERVSVRHEVTAHTERVDEILYPGVLIHR